MPATMFATATRASLMELPPELLDQALAELKYIDLARCREVSAHLFVVDEVLIKRPS